MRDIADPIAGSNFRTDSFASLAVSQQRSTDGSYPLYLAYTSADSSGVGTTVVRTASSQAVATWAGIGVPGQSGYAFFAAADVAPNGRVDVGWQSQTQANTADFGTGNATIRSYYASFTPGDAAFSSAARIDSASTNDPAASSQNNLKRQFWGDYNTLVSTNGAAYFIYTDARHGTGCPVVDAYQHDLTSPKPTPCSGPTFGDTDIFVSKVTP